MAKRKRDGTYAPYGNKRHCTISDRRKKSINVLYDIISVDKDDKRASRELADDTLKAIIGHIRNNQLYGHIYDHRIVKAGSHPINAKIGSADEFDTHILLNLGKKSWCRCSCSNVGIHYNYVTDETSDMRQCRRLSTGFNVPIPNGCAVVKVQNIGNTQRFIHTKEREIIVHKPVFPPVFCRYTRRLLTVPHYDTVITEINRNSDGKIEIIPRNIKPDVHAKLRTAISGLRMHNVKLDDNAHGPALTLTISPDKNRGVHHSISVNLTVSLKCSLQLQEFNWPRSETLRAFDEELIDRAIEAGIHLVPKKDLFWSISFSRAERALLSGIDAGSGCRKKILKILKCYLEDCNSRSPTDLKGISSHILKTQVLWSCEIHADDPDYWKHDNRVVCLRNTMRELEQSLIEENLDDYFNDSINLLQGKDIRVLHQLAHYLNIQRKKL